MINVIFRAVFIASIAFLNACGGGGSDGPANNNTTTNLLVKTADGGSVTITGTFDTGCYSTDTNNDGTQDGVKEFISFFEDNWTYTTNSYDSDTACSGVPVVEVVSATLTLGSDVNATSWIDGTSTGVTAPGVIATNASYTMLNGVVSQSDNANITVGMNISLGYVIDNFTSANGMVLYRLDDPVAGVVTIADSYTNIVVPPPPAATGPDLQVTITSVTNTSFSSSTISYTVTNVGDTDSGAFNVLAWHDRATAPDYLSAQSGFFNTVTNLAAGASTTLATVVDSVTVTPGTALNAYVIADFFEAVSEADEGLTGTSDNLSHMAWTVGDIFLLNGTYHIGTNEVATVDATHDTVIDAYFDTFNTISFIKMSSGYQPANLPALIYEMRLTTEFTPGVYSDSGVLYYFMVIINGQAFATFPTSDSSVTITSAGLAGELITGSVNANVCPVNSVAYTGPTTASCSVAVTNYTGSFSFIRDANQ